jgi:hypothetical protein
MACKLGAIGGAKRKLATALSLGSRAPVKRGAAEAARFQVRVSKPRSLNSCSAVELRAHEASRDLEVPLLRCVWGLLRWTC